MASGHFVCVYIYTLYIYIKVSSFKVIVELIYVSILFVFIYSYSYITDVVRFYDAGEAKLNIVLTNMAKES